MQPGAARCPAEKCFPDPEPFHAVVETQQPRPGGEAGFASYWLAQSGAIDALSALAFAATRAPGIELGTAVIPTYPKPPNALRISKASRLPDVRSCGDGKVAGKLARPVIFSASRRKRSKLYGPNRRGAQRPRCRGAGNRARRSRKGDLQEGCATTKVLPSEKVAPGVVRKVVPGIFVIVKTYEFTERIFLVVADWDDKYRELADRFFRTTFGDSGPDGGRVSDVLDRLIGEGERIDRVVAMGCMFTMMKTAEITRLHQLDRGRGAGALRVRAQPLLSPA